MDKVSKKDFYYLSIAETVADGSTCCNRKRGAVIVKNDQIISSGYSGIPDNLTTCMDKGFCVKTGQSSHEIGTICYGLHAEEAAIIGASKSQMHNAIMYVYSYDKLEQSMPSYIDSCARCKKMIIAAGISTVVYNDINFGLFHEEYPYRARVVHVSDWIDDYITAT